MPFDALTFSRHPAPGPVALTTLIDAAGAPCPVWAAENPDRALAFLFVAPQDCAAVDVIVAQ